MASINSVFENATSGDKIKPGQRGGVWGGGTGEMELEMESVAATFGNALDGKLGEREKSLGVDLDST